MAARTGTRRRRAAAAAVADPRVGQRVAHERREGEVVEAADGAAEVLDADAGRREHEVGAAAGVGGEAARGDGRGEHALDVEPGERAAQRGGLVGGLPGQRDAAGDVGEGLVGVERGGGPPVGDGGLRRGRVGEGEEEVADGGLVRGVPAAVPEHVEAERRGGEDGAHVVAEVHQVGAALVPLGRAHERVAAAAAVRVRRGRHRRDEKAWKQEDNGGGERHSDRE